MTKVTDPVLYSFRRCPYAMRARLALVFSGTRCELREVKLSNKPQAMLAVSPKGTVPVLLLPDGQVIDESLDIMRWALARNDPDGWLSADDPELIGRNDAQFKHDLDRYKYPERHDSDPLCYRERGVEFLAELDRRAGEFGQLCRARPGMADMAIMPFVRQFAAVDQQWFSAQPLPSLHRWLAGHLNSALFAAVMVRLKPWAQGDTPTVFP